MTLSPELGVVVAPLMFAKHLNLQPTTTEKTTANRNKIINEQKEKLIQKIKTILTDWSEGIQANIPEPSRTPLFQYRISKNKLNDPITLDLDFLLSPLNNSPIYTLLGELEKLPEHNKLFKYSYAPRLQTLLPQLSEKICERLREDQRTASATIQSNGHLAKQKFWKAQQIDNKQKWHFLLDFSYSPLTHDEVQKVLWDFIHLRGYGEAFCITDLNFSGSYADIQKLMNPKRKNKQYPEVQGSVIINALCSTVATLYLNNYSLQRGDLVALKLFKKLEELRLDNCEHQDPDNPVTPEEIDQALPKLKCFSMVNDELSASE